MADYRVGELEIEAYGGEGVGHWARRVVDECKASGTSARATFNGVSIRVGSAWTPETVLREWDRTRLGKLTAEGAFTPTRPASEKDVPRPNVLAEAAKVVSGDRQHSYGHPRDNHGCTAAMWSAYLTRKYGADQATLDARDVCMLNALQKISRDANRPKWDNLVDIAGYMRNAEMLDDD